MKLTDLDTKNAPVKALKENFAMDFDVSSLDKPKTAAMLSKVKKLIGESKRSPEFHKAQHNPAYLKLVFMEQALNQHLKVAKSPRIVLENEEVEKSQVILAAQDMIDTVQKMYEDINDMLVKELPALVDSIQSEIGVNESDSFSQSANQALTTLNASLQETQTALKGALGGLTGQGSADAFAAGEPEMDADMGAEMGADLGADDEAALNMEPEGGLDLPPLPDMGDEEEAPLAAAGRAKR
jgi:hypothetical protein